MEEGERCFVRGGARGFGGAPRRLASLWRAGGEEVGLEGLREGSGERSVPVVWCLSGGRMAGVQGEESGCAGLWKNSFT